MACAEGELNPQRVELRWQRPRLRVEYMDSFLLSHSIMSLNSNVFDEYSISSFVRKLGIQKCGKVPIIGLKKLHTFSK